MDESLYSPEISGEVRWADNGGYCYFHPNPLPLAFTVDEDTRDLMDRAMLALGRLDGKVSHMSTDERSMLTRAFTMKGSALSYDDRAVECFMWVPAPLWNRSCTG